MPWIGSCRLRLRCTSVLPCAHVALVRACAGVQVPPPGDAPVGTGVLGDAPLVSTFTSTSLVVTAPPPTCVCPLSISRQCSVGFKATRCSLQMKKVRLKEVSCWQKSLTWNLVSTRFPKAHTQPHLHTQASGDPFLHIGLQKASV